MEKKNEDYIKIQKIHERNIIKNKNNEPLEEEKYTLPYESYADKFDEKLFFTLLDKYTPKMIEDKINSRKKKESQIKPGMDIIMEMLLDITDESEKYLKDHNVNLIEIPNWENWMDLFIENTPISEYYRKIEEKSHQKTEINPNEMDNENTEENLIYSYCEFFDYIHYMGKWNLNMKNIILKRDKKSKKLKPIELSLYDILGNDIAFMLNGGKFQIAGLKEKDLQKMNNSEFEPGNLDISNITLPVYNISNQTLGEILEMYLDMKFELIDINGGINPFDEKDKKVTDTQEIKTEDNNEEEKKEEEKKENKPSILGFTQMDFLKEFKKEVNPNAIDEENEFQFVEQEEEIPKNDKPKKNLSPLERFLLKNFKNDKEKKIFYYNLEIIFEKLNQELEKNIHFLNNLWSFGNVELTKENILSNKRLSDFLNGNLQLLILYAKFIATKNYLNFKKGNVNQKLFQKIYELMLKLSKSENFGELFEKNNFEKIKNQQVEVNDNIETYCKLCLHDINNEGNKNVFGFDFHISCINLWVNLIDINSPFKQ